LRATHGGAASYESVGAESICSYDRDFDDISGVRRTEPDSAAKQHAFDALVERHAPPDGKVFGMTKKVAYE
jgi:hypothetical protein